MASEFWKKCTTCKKPIGFKTRFWVCNVSTCNRKRTGLTFCSVECWDAHLPVVRHREAWAEERRSPNEGEEFEAPKKTEAAPTQAPQTPKNEAPRPPVPPLIRRRTPV